MWKHYSKTAFIWLQNNKRTIIIEIITQNTKSMHPVAYVEYTLWAFYFMGGGGRGRDLIVVGLTTIYAISALSPLTLWVRIPLKRGVLDTTLCDKVCQWLAAGRWFSLGTVISPTNKTDCYDIHEILLNVTLNTVTITLYNDPFHYMYWFYIV